MEVIPIEKEEQWKAFCSKEMKLVKTRLKGNAYFVNKHFDTPSYLKARHAEMVNEKELCYEVYTMKLRLTYDFYQQHKIMLEGSSSLAIQLNGSENKSQHYVRANTKYLHEVENEACESQTTIRCFDGHTYTDVLWVVEAYIMRNLYLENHNLIPNGKTLYETAQKEFIRLRDIFKN